MNPEAEGREQRQKSVLEGERTARPAYMEQKRRTLGPQMVLTGAAIPLQDLSRAQASRLMTGSVSATD